MKELRQGHADTSQMNWKTENGALGVGTKEAAAAMAARAADAPKAGQEAAKPPEDAKAAEREDRLDLLRRHKEARERAAQGVAREEDEHKRGDKGSDSPGAWKQEWRSRDRSPVGCA